MEFSEKLIVVNLIRIMRVGIDGGKRRDIREEWFYFVFKKKDLLLRYCLDIVGVW